MRKETKHIFMQSNCKSNEMHTEARKTQTNRKTINQTEHHRDLWWSENVLLFFARSDFHELNWILCLISHPASFLSVCLCITEFAISVQLLAKMRNSKDCSVLETWLLFSQLHKWDLTAALIRFQATESTDQPNCIYYIWCIQPLDDKSRVLMFVYMNMSVKVLFMLSFNFSWYQNEQMKVNMELKLTQFMVQQA